MRRVIASLLLFCCLAVKHANGQVVFVRTLDAKAKIRVGTLLNESADRLVIRELSDGSEVTLVKSELKKIEKGDDAAIAAVGLPLVTAIRVSEVASRTNASGKIARVTQNVVYLTLGEKSGITVKQKLNVFRNSGEIRDPDTNKLIGTERAKIGVLEVTEVNQEMSKAKSQGDLEVALQPGDEVEEARAKMQVAVMPFRSEAGRQDDAGIGLAEEITTQLTRNNVAVLERSLIERVLTEQLVQNTILFEPEPIQRIGHLLGASTVLTGKIVAKDKENTAFVRLIDVQTGKVLFAAHGTVKRTKSVSTNSKKSDSDSSTGTTRTRTESSDDSDAPSSTAKSAPDRQGGKWLELGGRNKFPAMFQSNKEAMSEKGGLTINGRNYVLSRKGDFLTRDFKFEIVYSFKEPAPKKYPIGIMFFGIGEADRTSGNNEPGNSVYLRIHPPSADNGSVGLANEPGHSFAGLGKVTGPGPHRAIIEKEGDMVTYSIDVDNDGTSDDDLENTVPDIKETGNFLHKKNTYLFFGGGAVFHRLRLTTPD